MQPSRVLTQAERAFSDTTAFVSNILLIQLSVCKTKKKKKKFLAIVFLLLRTLFSSIGPNSSIGSFLIWLFVKVQRQVCLCISHHCSCFSQAGFPWSTSHPRVCEDLHPQTAKTGTASRGCRYAEMGNSSTEVWWTIGSTWICKSRGPYCARKTSVLEHRNPQRRCPDTFVFLCLCVPHPLLPIVLYFQS